MSDAAVQTRLWSREEYERLIAGGMFHPEERLELIEGEILQMSPQGSTHATAVILVENTLRKVFGSKYVVRVQMPLALGPNSEPEPDLAVVPGSPRDYRDEHPQTAELVVEVADTTLTYDRSKKSIIYARAGIQEYWILNLIERQLEVYRQPRSEPSSTPLYKDHLIITATESLSPLHFSQDSFLVTDLLP